MSRLAGAGKVKDWRACKEVRLGGEERKAGRGRAGHAEEADGTVESGGREGREGLDVVGRGTDDGDSGASLSWRWL